jgi:hypothetical protein
VLRQDPDDGVAQRIGEIDQGFDGEANLGVVTGRDVHDTSVTPSLSRVRY